MENDDGIKLKKQKYRRVRGKLPAPGRKILRGLS